MKEFIQRAIVALVLVMVPAAFAAAGEQLRLLIIDGQNNHDWKATTPAMRTLLARCDRFRVDVLTTPPESKADQWSNFQPDFSSYDVVLLNYFGQDWPTEAHARLEDFVARGGGLVAVHAGVAPFAKRAAFNRMIGMGWRDANFGPRLAIDGSGQLIRMQVGEGHGAGHGHRHVFAVHSQAPHHPITRDLPPTWTHAADELYHGMPGPAENVEILATTYSNATQLNEPVLWTVRFGKGRVFVTVLGHDAAAMECVGFSTTLARGCEWAATSRVTLGVPSNFPTAKGAIVGNPAWPGPIPRRETIAKHIDPMVKLDGPYAAIRLPISKGVPLHNPTAVTVGPGGKIYAANYTGQIVRLEDHDGDGLEETAALFADISKDGKQYPCEDAGQYKGTPQHGGLRYPTGLVFKGRDCYVATTQGIHIYRDTDGDEVADESEVFASGWPFTMHYFDWTFGLRFGPDGHLYTILSTDYLNGQRKPDPRGLRGSILRISPDGKTIEKFANGLRYAYDLAFSPKGDLFFTDNKGGGNPTEELNYAVRGANYGHNPNPHKQPKIAPRNPILAIRHGAGSGGLAFNPPENDFGGTAGDLFIAMWGPDGQWDKGSIVRVRLTKRDDGTYEVVEHLFAMGPSKVIDLCFAPRGDLYVARFGREGPAHVPYAEPEGDIYRFIYAPWLEHAESQCVPVANPLRRELAGDPAQGLLIFRQRACNVCHTVDGSMNKLGPDLKEVGSTLDYSGLLESISQPSKNIKTGFESHVILQDDGRIVSGRICGTDEKQIRLMQEGNKFVSVPRAEIDEIKMLTTSLMPEGITKGLSDEAVNDLVAYLQSLRSDDPVVRINVGGPEITNAEGYVWQADREYRSGGYGAVGGNVFLGRGDPLVETCRWGNFGYRFDVDNGQYEVTLIAREPVFTEANRRIFSVRVEGKPALEDIDLAMQAAIGKAIRKTVRCQVRDHQLDIDFSAAVNHPLLSAIEVRAVSPHSDPDVDDKNGLPNQRTVSPPLRPSFGWQQDDSSLALRNGQNVVWRIRYRKEEGKPYFHPLGLTDGTELTSLRPADHPWHRAAWFSWKYLNGLNYWEEDSKTGLSPGRTDLVDVKVIPAKDHSAKIEMALSYHPPERPAVLKEKRLIAVSTPDERGWYHIDWHSDFVAGKEDVVLNRTPIAGEEGGRSYGGYAGLSARMAESTRGWHFINSEGHVGPQIHGRQARWMDFSGQTATGQAAGIAVFDHPNNLRHPSPWYVAETMPFFSPAILYNESLTLKAGKRLRLSYRILVHHGRGEAKWLNSEFQRFAQTALPLAEKGASVDKVDEGAQQ